MQKEKKIINLYFATHKTCNMNCEYCYVPSYNRLSLKEDDKIILKSLDEFISKFEAEDYSIGVFCLHGSEATLMEANTLGEIINKVNTHWKRNNISGFEVAIQSNGKRLTNEYLGNLLEVINNPKKLRIGFSIDPPKKVHDILRDNSFDIVMQNFENAIDLAFPVSVLSVVGTETIKNITLFGDWMKKQIKRKNKFGNPYKIKIKFATGDYALSEDELKYFSKYLIENDLLSLPQILSPGYCIQNGNDCVWFEFDIHGNCYSCNKTYDNNGIFANWHDESFEQIIIKRKELYSKNFQHQECSECTYEFLCNSGCPIDRYYKGVMRGKAHECTLVKTVYDYISTTNMHIIDFYNNN